MAHPHSSMAHLDLPGAMTLNSHKSHLARKQGLVGVVVKVLPHKGYGFLVHRGRAGLEEVFFHVNCLDGVEMADLYPGKAVGFYFGRDREGKGPKARLLWAGDGDGSALWEAWKTHVKENGRG